MQAIVTTYCGPTNTQGSRIIAKCQAGRIVHHFDYGLGVEGNHHAAAEKLVRKLGWTPAQGSAFAERWIAGGMPGGNGNVYVLAACAEGFTISAEA
jgi:hypothetical protein